jgi:hypothetical protein
VNGRLMTGFVPAVARSITWRRVLTAWMLGFATLLVRSSQSIGSADLPSTMLASGLVITNLGALLVLLAALSADEAIRRGIRPWLAVAVPLVMASVGTALGQWYIRGWFHFYSGINRPGVPIDVQRTMMIYVAGDTLMFGGYAMLAFLNRRNAQRILEGIRGAELRRVQLEQQLTESRLAMTRAQIDPSALFESLGEIRGLYASAAPQADRKMDELIQRLQHSVTENVVAGKSRMSAR